MFLALFLSCYMVERDGSKVTEAILDVGSSHPGGLNKFYVDVTIRAPHAQRYQNTDSVPGVAAKGGESDKLEPYGAQVMPLSFEPYGRLGSDSMASLRSLALCGSTFYNNSARFSAAGLCSIWKAELERILVFEVTDIVLLSLGLASGAYALRNRRKRRHDPG